MYLLQIIFVYSYIYYIISAMERARIHSVYTHVFIHIFIRIFIPTFFCISSLSVSTYRLICLYTRVNTIAACIPSLSVQPCQHIYLFIRWLHNTYVYSYVYYTISAMEGARIHSVFRVYTIFHGGTTPQ